MKVQFIKHTPLSNRLRELAEPACAACGVDCFLVEVMGTKGRLKVRVYIDAIDGVDIEDCTKVSRQLSAVLDVEDPIEGAYHLEVSSPGLNRPLRDLDDMRAAIDQMVYLETAEPLDGRKRFTGRLLAVEEETIVLAADGQNWRIPAAAVRKAKIEPSFQR